MSTPFDQSILANQNPSASIGPFDGLVAAYMCHKEAHIICTSPNQNYIPLPILDDDDVRLRINLRYGTADHTLWPQIVTPNTSHFAVMPRKPVNNNDPLAPIWWDPTPADFVPSYGGIINGIGTMQQHYLDSLQQIEAEMQKRVNEYVEASPKPSVTALEQINLRRYHMENAFVRLMSLRVSYTETVFTITEFQRYCLEIIGFLNYMRVYRSRLGGARLGSYPPDNVMGCFTWDPRTVQDLFTAGVPVWFLRRWEGPIYPFSNNILRIVNFTHPDPCLLKEHNIITFPTLFRGQMADEKRYSAIWNYSLARLTSTDPFQAEPTSTSSTVPLSSHPSSSRPYPPQGSRPVKANTPPSRVAVDKFSPLKDSAAPYPIHAWRDGLAAVDRSPANLVDSGDVTRTRGGLFVCPDPGVVVGPASEEKKARFLTTWLQCRQKWFMIVEDEGRALSNQSWRDLLGLDLSQPPKEGAVVPQFEGTPTAGPSQSRSTLPTLPIHPSLPMRPSHSLPMRSSRPRSAKTTKPQERRAEIMSLLQSKSIFADAVQSLDASPKLVWNAAELESNTLPPQHIIREILWELYEINFVYELESLDRLACADLKSDSVTLFERQRLVVHCYDNVSQYKHPTISARNIGLAANDIMDRLPYLISLARLMKSWKGSPPRIITKYSDARYPEIFGKGSAEQFEKEVSRFYCQTFYNYFGRAAQVPHRLYELQ